MYGISAMNFWTLWIFYSRLIFASRYFDRWSPFTPSEYVNTSSAARCKLTAYEKYAASSRVWGVKSWKAHAFALVSRLCRDVTLRNNPESKLTNQFVDPAAACFCGTLLRIVRTKRQSEKDSCGNNEKNLALDNKSCVRTRRVEASAVSHKDLHCKLHMGRYSRDKTLGQNV